MEYKANVLDLVDIKLLESLTISWTTTSTSKRPCARQTRPKSGQCCNKEVSASQSLILVGIPACWKLEPLMPCCPPKGVNASVPANAKTAGVTVTAAIRPTFNAPLHQQQQAFWEEGQLEVVQRQSFGLHPPRGMPNEYTAEATLLPLLVEDLPHSSVLSSPLITCMHYVFQMFRTRQVMI